MSCNLGQQTKKTARVRNLISACLMAVTFFTASVFAKDRRPGPQVIAEVKHDTSLSLRDMEASIASQATAAPRRVMPLLLPHPATGEASVQADTALQKVDLPFVSASLGLNFDGLGQGQNGFVVNAAPPDTNGVVGATQYVQWVNSSFAVFDKATGARLMGPTAGNAFWAGFGGGCQSNNDGDPVIQYDKMANRWVATQFSVSTTPFLQCVAVSTTNDATGSYNRYAFTLPNFNDYPKLGIWSDGYYFSFKMFNAAGTIFFGADACAANRTAMLAGNAATMICFQQSSNVASLLPSDTDGTIKPASGEPAFFMNFGTNSLNLWKFHVDFTTPANSTFTGPTTLAVASFTPLCNGGSNCVVQPGTTQKLDSLADRLMYRLAWRKFADGHESEHTHCDFQVPELRQWGWWTGIGIRNGTLTFNDDASTNPQKVALTGTGTQISLSPVSLNFGTVAVGATSAAKSVTVTNVGTTTVTFTGFSIAGTNPGDYLVSGKTCGTSLAGRELHGQLAVQANCHGNA